MFTLEGGMPCNVLIGGARVEEMNGFVYLGTFT